MAAQARGEMRAMTITAAAISTNKVANNWAFIVGTVYRQKLTLSISVGLMPFG